MIFKAWPAVARPFVSFKAQNNAKYVLYYAQMSVKQEIHPSQRAFVVYLGYMSDMLGSQGTGSVL